MTRKHYKAIAEVLKDRRDRADRDGWESEQARRSWRAACDSIALDLCDVLKADNSRFDRSRFLTACGVE